MRINNIRALSVTSGGNLCLKILGISSSNSYKFTDRIITMVFRRNHERPMRVTSRTQLCDTTLVILKIGLSFGIDDNTFPCVANHQM